MINAFVRGACALAVGASATLAICLVGALFGLFQRALGLIGIRTHFEALVIGSWGYAIHHVCLERVLGVKVEIEGEIQPLQEDEIALCIGNHPSTIAAGSFAWFVTTFVTRRVIAVAKYEHLRNPIGWCLKSLGVAIFVDRSDAIQSDGAVVKRLSQEIETPCALILFPDTGRPSRKNIAQDIGRFLGKIERIEQWLTQTRAPRSGGLHAALQTLNGKNVRAFNITIALCSQDWSVVDIMRRRDRVLKIVVEEVVELPLTREELERWLNAEWKRKNTAISRWRGESP